MGKSLWDLAVEAADALWAIKNGKEPARDPIAINQDIYALRSHIAEFFAVPPAMDWEKPEKEKFFAFCRDHLLVRIFIGSQNHPDRTKIMFVKETNADSGYISYAKYLCETDLSGGPHLQKLWNFNWGDEEYKYFEREYPGFFSPEEVLVWEYRHGAGFVLCSIHSIKLLVLYAFFLQYFCESESRDDGNFSNPEVFLKHFRRFLKKQQEAFEKQLDLLRSRKLHS